MTDRERGLKSEVGVGDQVAVGDIAVRTQSRALTARWPGGGWVWNRPVAVLVEHGDEERRIPIVDVTRVAQLGLFGLSLVFAAIGLALWIMGRSGSDERDTE